MREIILKEIYFERELSKTLNCFYNPVPFNWKRYQKQKGPETSDQLLFRLQNNFRKVPLLVMYYLTKFDDVI